MKLYFMVSTLAAIIVLGCGPQSNGILYKDVEFIPYVESYLKYKQTYGLEGFQSFPITIQFGELPPGKGGQCNVVNTTVAGVKTVDRTITIDRYWWASINEAQKEILMFHELGHCDLDIRHHLDYGPNIMNTYILDYNIYLTRKEELLKNLFRRQ